MRLPLGLCTISLLVFIFYLSVLFVFDVTSASSSFEPRWVVRGSNDPEKRGKHVLAISRHRNSAGPLSDEEKVLEGLAAMAAKEERRRSVENEKRRKERERGKQRKESGTQEKEEGGGKEEEAHTHALRDASSDSATTAQPTTPTFLGCRVGDVNQLAPFLANTTTPITTEVCADICSAKQKYLAALYNGNR